MKIYMYISELCAGGAERVCVNLANELTLLFHEVHLIVLNRDRDAYSQLLDEKVIIHSLDATRIRYGVIPLVKLIRKEKIEKILVFGNEMGTFLSMCRSMGLIDCKIVVRVLNNTQVNVTREEGGTLLVRKIVKNSQKQLCRMDFVIAQCQAMEKMLQDQLQLGDKCRYIYNPVSKYLVKNTKKINTGKCRKIGYIGRIDPQKNIGDLLKAFAILCQSENDVCLHLYGNGCREDYAKQLVKELQISDKVFFEGIRKDMENVYSELSMVALSSEYEGMPNALIEAIAVGIPVVSYDCPIGPSEIIENDINGYLTPMWDVQALAEGMKKCLNHDWDEALIRESAVKFDSEAIAREYEKVLMEI